MTYDTINDARTIGGGSDSALGRIDQYELVRELGGGGFGTVYLAKDTVAGIEVAVKGLPPLIRNNAEELERIRENFALVSRLHHPYIAAALHLQLVRDVSYNDDTVREKLRVMPGDTLMVMEYAPGVTLSKWRRQFPGRKVPFEQAIQLVWQIAQTLDYAHEQHILHRDVKPSNIMVETKPDGEVVARLLDFGLAAEIRSSMGRVSREIHDTSGTRPYMAPEQWAGRKQGPATDQYALAVLLCELLTGEVPFASVFETGDPVVMMTTVCNREVELPEDCPRQTVLCRALSKEPLQRFTSCMEFIEAMVQPELVRKSSHKGRWTTKRLWGVVFIVVTLLCVFVVGGRNLYRYQKERQREQARIAAEQKAEAERLARKEAERKALEQAEVERLAREEADRKARRLAQEEFERERKAVLEKVEKERKIKKMKELESKIDEYKGRINNILKGKLNGDWMGFDASKIIITDVAVNVKEESPFKMLSNVLSCRDTMEKIDVALQSLAKEVGRLEARLNEIARVKGVYDANDLESRKEECVPCHGTGAIKCTRCKGTCEIVLMESKSCPTCSKYSSDDYYAEQKRLGQIEKEMGCPRCNGKGRVFRRCTACDGKGKVTRRRYGARFDATVVCDNCYGNKGEWDDCPKCDGSGSVSVLEKCLTCKGVGVVSKGKKVTCPVCSGKGGIKCGNCNGRGFTYRPKEELRKSTVQTRNVSDVGHDNTHGVSVQQHRNYDGRFSKNDGKRDMKRTPFAGSRHVQRTGDDLDHLLGVLEEDAKP